MTSAASQMELWVLVAGVAAFVVVVAGLLVVALQLRAMAGSIQSLGVRQDAMAGSLQTLGERLHSAERWYDSDQGRALDLRIDELARRIDIVERNQATFEVRMLQLPTAEQLAGAHSKIDSFRREFDHFDAKLSHLEGGLGRVQHGVDKIQEFLMESGR